MYAFLELDAETLTPMITLFSIVAFVGMIIVALVSIFNERKNEPEKPRNWTGLGLAVSAIGGFIGIYGGLAYLTANQSVNDFNWIWDHSASEAAEMRDMADLGAAGAILGIVLVIVGLLVIIIGKTSAKPAPPQYNLGLPPVNEVPTASICPECGSRIDLRAKFCPECGHAFAHCPHCGGAVHDENAMFCTLCGKSLTEKLEYCVACGGEMKAADKFCPSCGAKK